MIKTFGLYETEFTTYYDCPFYRLSIPTKHGSDNPPLGHMNSGTVVFDFLLASKNLPLSNKYFTVWVDREICIQGYFANNFTPSWIRPDSVVF